MPCDNEKGNLVTTGEMLSWLKKKKKKTPGCAGGLRRLGTKGTRGRGLFWGFTFLQA